MDICQLILDDHAEQRRLFAILEEIGPGDPEALAPVWARLKGLLDVHAEAEERFFYPDLLMVGKGANDADDAADETKDAIEDHNDIRDTGEKVDAQAIGSDRWFTALGACNLANSKHMAEEERQGLTDFRIHATRERRHQLATKFAAFEAAHLLGLKPVDKDPDGYVKEHSPAA